MGAATTSDAKASNRKNEHHKDVQNEGARPEDASKGGKHIVGNTAGGDVRFQPRTVWTTHARGAYAGALRADRTFALAAGKSGEFLGVSVTRTLFGIFAGRIAADYG